MGCTGRVCVCTIVYHWNRNQHKYTQLITPLDAPISTTWHVIRVRESHWGVLAHQQQFYEGLADVTPDIVLQQTAWQWHNFCIAMTNGLQKADHGAGDQCLANDRPGWVCAA